MCCLNVLFWIKLYLSIGYRFGDFKFKILAVLFLNLYYLFFFFAHILGSVLSSACTFS